MPPAQHRTPRPAPSGTRSSTLKHRREAPRWTRAVAVSIGGGWRLPWRRTRSAPVGWGGARWRSSRARGHGVVACATTAEPGRAGHRLRCSERCRRSSGTTSCCLSATGTAPRRSPPARGRQGRRAPAAAAFGAACSPRRALAALPARHLSWAPQGKWRPDGVRQSKCLAHRPEAIGPALRELTVRLHRSDGGAAGAQAVGRHRAG